MTYIYAIYDKKSASLFSIEFFQNNIVAYRTLKSKIFDICDKNKFFNEKDFEIKRLGLINTVDLDMTINPIEVLPVETVDDNLYKDMLKTVIGDKINEL